MSRAANLNSWEGGGFGVSATTDGTAFRYVRLFVDAPERSEELTVPTSLEDAAMRAQLYPADYFLRQLAQGVADCERRYGRPISIVRVEAWRIDFEGEPLKGIERRLRSFTLYVSPPVEYVSQPVEPQLRRIVLFTRKCRGPAWESARSFRRLDEAMPHPIPRLR